MAGDLEAWERMKEYNKQDVVVLEQVYLKLRPWIDNHPSMALLNDRPEACPKCGHDKFESKGLKVTKTGKYRRFACKNCGGYSQLRIAEKTIKPLYTN